MLGLMHKLMTPLTRELTLRRLAALDDLIGDTPLLAIELLDDGQPRTLYAKLESKNFTGSIKDRMAFHILESAYERGEIEPGATIVEATSGNTGISFAAVGRAMGHPVRIFMPDWMSQERVAVIRSLGAEIIPVSMEEGGFLGAIRLAEQDAGDGRSQVFHPRQFESESNVEAHAMATGPELVDQLGSLGLTPTAFVAGVGTGGTVMGVGRFFREQVPQATVHPLEPADSPTLRTGTKVGKHRIQGISDEFIPPIVDLAGLDEIVDVRDGDAILMAQRLAEQLGLAVGISSGANFVGALKCARQQGPEAVVATVFPDSNKKYLSTDLCRVEPVQDGDLTPHVQLLTFRVVKV